MGECARAQRQAEDVSSASIAASMEAALQRQLQSTGSYSYMASYYYEAYMGSYSYYYELDTSSTVTTAAPTPKASARARARHDDRSPLPRALDPAHDHSPLPRVSSMRD